MKNIYVYSSITGIYVLDNELKLLKKLDIDENEQKDISAYNWTKIEKSLLDELESDSSSSGARIHFVGHKNEKQSSESNIIMEKNSEHSQKVLGYFKSIQYFSKYREANIKITRALIRKSIADDDLIIQSANSVDEVLVLINTISKRLREWYALHNPEFVHSCNDSKALAENIVKKSKDELLKELGIPDKDSMGADIRDVDLDAIRLLADKIIELYKYREQQVEYLDSCMSERCPNLRAVAGAILGAKLLALAGSLQKMAEMPASTIQLLGAEKALFRHIKTGAKCPKYGIIHEHPLISKVKRDQHGKVSRALADKMSLAVKIDYFRGEFIGDKLVADLEKRFVNTTNKPN